MNGNNIHAGELKVHRLSHAVGASVSGIDFTRPLPAKTRDAVLEAWKEHLVLVFPKADMTLAQQVAFTRQFGEVELHPLKSLRHPDVPEVFEVTNRQMNGRPSESAEVGRVWHSDGAYTTRPPTGSLLHCRMLPRAGGTTWFNNMYMAYEALSPGMKKLLDQLEVVNDLLGPGALTPLATQRDEAVTRQEQREVPAVVQPAVRVHPASGRKALYVNPVVTRRFANMRADESQGLLQYLFSHATKAEFVYCHYWHLNDLVMWDNRCAMHLAPADYPATEIRQMYRTTLKGEPLGRALAQAEAEANHGVAWPI